VAEKDPLELSRSAPMALESERAITLAAHDLQAARMRCVADAAGGLIRMRGRNPRKVQGGEHEKLRRLTVWRLAQAARVSD
jgi:hypothetical protein